MTEAQSFLAEIERFLVRTGMSPGTFGRRTADDWKLVDRLRRGGSVTLVTADRVRKYMADYRPEHEKERRRVA